MRSSFLFGCCFSPTRFRLNIRLMNIRYRIRLHKYKKLIHTTQPILIPFIATSE
jgi:hypothetical protein